jgi:predicted nucleotidyltransferase
MDELHLQANATAVLREAGASFAFIHGSRAEGRATSRSDLDVAAWWPSDPPLASDVLFDGAVDLLVLNDAPLELAGRVAMWGQLLFDDDPPARVHWVADTRKIYLDELPRLRRYERELLESLARGR